MEHMYMKWTALVRMAALMFVVMYALMYMMVDVFGNVYANVNQFYMAVAMTGAMMLLEIATMRSMYASRVKTITVGVSAIVLIVSLVAVREQVAVGDREFLKSMIPHHGAALLMCDKAKLQDPEIKKLCEGIIAGQQSEIDWMRGKLSTVK